MQKSIPVTCHSTTVTLAYLQYYNCKYIPGRYLTNTDLRRLAVWLGCPDTNLRTLRRHPLLAAHIALLQAANLLHHNETFWYLTPDAFNWLNQSAANQYDWLLKPITSCQFSATIKSMGLSDSLPLDFIAFIQQQLRRQSQQPQPEPGTALWQQCAPDAWHLCLPPTLPQKLLFHVLQLGDWQPGHPLSMTPLTIGQAIHRGYNLTYITWLLQQTSGTLLSPRQQQQLLNWYRRHDAYRLRPVILLSVKQPEQLARIIKNGNLRPHIQEQITPRHAITSPAIQPSLQKWAARHGYPLNTPAVTPSETSRSSEPGHRSPPATPTGYQWLGLHLLTTLGQIIPLPYPPPHAELETLAAHISPEEQSQLSALAGQIIASLQDAIHGRDAFFPASQSLPAEWLPAIRQALMQETDLEIEYQSLGDRKPSWRRIQPLRLEQVGDLHYLHAYCCHAEANRTFRLDRIHTISTLTT